MNALRLALGLALLPAPGAFAQAPDTGAWIVARDASALDNADTQATATLASTNSLPNSHRQLEHAALIYRCNGGGQSSIYIVWPASLGKDAVPQIRYRVGDSKVESSYWRASTDKKATFATVLNHELQRLESALAQTGPDDHTAFVARVEPENRPPQEAQFDIAGAQAATSAANRLCGLGG